MLTVTIVTNQLINSDVIHISSQLTLPGDAQPWMWHTATALSLGPGQTRVTMFGGCPKWERGKTDAAVPKLAKTTVLEFGEQNMYMTLAFLRLPFPFCI